MVSDNKGDDASSLLTPRIVITRGQLKHSWIENKLLALGGHADFLVGLIKDNVSWDTFCQPNLAMSEKCLNFSLEAVEGFSPARFVECLEPLKALPTADRKALKQILHQYYLAESGMVEKAALIGSTTRSLIEKLNALFPLWQQAATVAEISLVWDGLMNDAGILRGIFEEIPRHIWIP